MKLRVSNATSAARGCVPKSSGCGKASAPTEAAAAGGRQLSYIRFTIGGLICRLFLGSLVNLVRCPKPALLSAFHVPHDFLEFVRHASVHESNNLDAAVEISGLLQVHPGLRPQSETGA
jgi:hypothetical protein